MHLMSGFRFMANHFNVVPIRTNDESRVVFAAVVRSQSGRAVVLATCIQRRTMEGIDLLAMLGHERQMKMRWLFFGLQQAQGRLAV